MNTRQRFEQWAVWARGEPVPAIDVTARVMRAIRRRQAGLDRRSDTPSLLVLAAAALLAASVMAAVALDAWSSLADPTSGLFHPLSLVIQ